MSLKKPDLLTTSKCDSDLLYTNEQVNGVDEVSEDVYELVYGWFVK
jgi:hypothetical protein